MQYQKISLPIDAYLEEILNQVQKSSTILLKASPGSGKTTRLPWFIAKNLGLKVVVLEPRRLAAKLAAERIAQEEGLKIGQEIGYHFRFDKKTSVDTRLIFYTEGTFLRKATFDNHLDDVDVVILDEFHERHLETDMALAWLLEQQSKRKNLKLILMSATLDTQITEHLDHPKVIEIEAKRFPIETTYLPNQPSILNRTLEQKIKEALLQIDEKSDVLVFLPGMREIRKVQSYLESHFGAVYILHSEISSEEQNAALAPSPQRKIILSTNLAESSVTIPGIKAVIDSGIQREAHYSPWNGLKIITDKPVTKSSAVQREGRAGRTSPGVCYRLYSKQDYDSREEFTLPDILKADLTDTYLMSLQMQSELKWITPPPPERWKKAKDLSFSMGLVDANEIVTELVQRAARYPLDSRLARVLIAAENYGVQEKRKLLNYICHEIENDSRGILFRKLSSYLDKDGPIQKPWESAMVAGFIDQVAKFRPKQNDFIHFSGKTIKTHPSQKDLTEGFYLILDITQRQEAIKILPINEEWLFEHEPFPFTEEDQISVEPQFKMKTFTKLGSLVVEESSVSLKWELLREDQKQQLIHFGGNYFLRQLERWKESEAYNRYFFWKKTLNEEANLNLSLRDYLDNAQTLSWDHLEEYFNHALSEFDLNRVLPWTINLGGKKELKVHYPFNQDPYVEAPIQDFYGQKETPRIMNNKLALTLRLIGPHKRPLQVTRDLNGFWTKTYIEMLKEFKREYPRHHWPDDPRTAPPLLLKRHLTP